jgi:hypothetical protein
MRGHFLPRALTVALVITLNTVGSFGEEAEKNYTIGGYGYWLSGQIVSGRPNEIITPDVLALSHQWLSSALVGITIISKPSDRLTLTFKPEMKLYYPIPEKSGIDTRRLRSVNDIREANGNFIFGNAENPFAELRLGLFNYKYNPDVRDLGEFLFRTGTYPAYIINNFDFAMARLCGLQVRTRPVNNLTLDAIFISELQYYPLYDFSLAFLAEYNFFKAFSFGAGVDFARIIPVDPTKTTIPEKEPNPSQVLVPQSSYKKNSADTGYSGRYSFKATKLMARGSFDVKALLGGLDFLGKEDLKVYGEIALTGMPIKSVPDSAHPDLYGDISRLMPMVAGFNIPAFKLLDVLSVEVEYFPNRMPNDYNQVASGVPLPGYGNLDPLTSKFYIRPPGKAVYDPLSYKGRDLGWAVYAKKEVVKGFSIIGQAAYDHVRMIDLNGYDQTYEIMSKHGDWAWMTKMEFSF